MLKQIRMELFKLCKKKTTHLLAITLLLPVLFIISIHVGTSFIVESEEFVYTDTLSSQEQALSAIGFATAMVGQSHFVIVFLFFAISSILFGLEVERGQIRLLAVRAGKRRRLIMSKFIAAQLMQIIFYVVFMLLMIAAYYLFVANTEHGSGQFFGDGYLMELLSVGIRMIGIAVFMSLNMLICVRLKAFAGFAATFIFWMVVRYLDNIFEQVNNNLLRSLFSPEGLVQIVLTEPNLVQIPLIVGVYIAYIAVFLLTAILLFAKRDLN